MDFKPRERVIVTNECGLDKFNGKIHSFNEFREPNMQYAVELEGFEDLCFVGENQLEKIEEAK